MYELKLSWAYQWPKMFQERWFHIKTKRRNLPIRILNQEVEPSFQFITYLSLVVLQLSSNNPLMPLNPIQNCPVLKNLHTK